MGTGKTSAAIAYMNSHPDKRFVYVTPYLDEANRIKTACPDLHFVEPSGKIPEYGFSKVSHTLDLLKKGRNITTTHVAFTNYPIEAANIIREQGYNLILDESLSMLEKSDISPSDFTIAIQSGLLEKKDGMVVRGKTEYGDGLFSSLLKNAEHKRLIVVEEAGQDTTYLWAIPPTVLCSFSEVIIMTYLFEGQELSLYMRANGIPYVYIGVEHSSSGLSFTDQTISDKELCKSVGSKIHIFDDDHWNSIGDDYNSLSKNWFVTKPDQVDSLRGKLGGYFNYVHKKDPNARGLWGTYTCGYSMLKGAGYSKLFLPFNARATNEYRDRDIIAYPCNVFANVRIKSVYDKMGAELDQDQYALSTMLQWIWRSAIRDGRDVDLYLPSSRMRDLLLRWTNGEFSIERGETNERRNVSA